MKPLIIIFITLIGIKSYLPAQYHWTIPTAVDSNSLSYEFSGPLAIDDSGVLYTAWVETSAIYIGRSIDRGDSWVKSRYSGTETERVPRDIAIDHLGNVWLLWMSWVNEFAQGVLNLSKSSDSGKTFEVLFQSLSYSNGLLGQKLGIDPRNNIYMLWDDSEFKITVFKEGDTARRIDTPIPNDTLLIGSFPVLVITHDFVVHCAWEGAINDINTGYKQFVFYTRSNDTGKSFQGRIRIDTIDKIGTTSIQHRPSMAIDSNGFIFISYTRELDTSLDIRLVESSNYGNSFGLPMIISENDSASYSRVCFDSKKGLNFFYESPRGTFHQRSSDEGLTFTQAQNIGVIAIQDIKASYDGYLYLTGELNQGRLGFSRTNIILATSEDPNILQSFALFQNYPNPFNPSTTIRFSIPKQAFVDLSVYDILGRQITSLVSGRLYPGIYSTSWNASDFSTGVYFVKLVVGGRLTVTKKLLLVR